MCNSFVTYSYLVCSLFAPGLLLTSEKAPRLDGSIILGSLLDAPGLLLTSEKRTAPRQEHHLDPLLGCCWPQKTHRASTRAIFWLKKRTAPRRERYFEGPGLLLGPVLYFQISPLGTPSPERENRRIGLEKNPRSVWRHPLWRGTFSPFAHPIEALSVLRKFLLNFLRLLLLTTTTTTTTTYYYNYYNNYYYYYYYYYY